MSNTIRREKNPNRKPRTAHVRNRKVALSICDCGEAITDGSALCLSCEIELEMFNGFSMEDLAVLEAQLEALEAVAV
jgi:hypothetical protein